MKVALVNLVRRGGMVHYHSQLANALATEMDLDAIVSDQVDENLYIGSIYKPVDTGASAKDTIKYLLLPHIWWRMANMIHSWKYDLVHVTSPHPHNLYILAFNRLPLAYTVHDINHHEGTPWHVRTMESWMRKRASILFVHSPEAAETLRNRYSNSKQIAVISHGDYSFFSQWSKPDVRQDKSVLFFGRIEEYKGLEYLLKAMPSVWQVFPDWRLVIAGQGDLSPYESLLEDERVEINNSFIPDVDVPGYFQRCQLVVLPYISATQSGVVPIASALARPTLATNVGNMAHVIEDGKTGWLVEPSDADKLAEAIIGAISDEQKLTLAGIAAKKKMDAEMGWDIISSKHVEAYSHKAK